jgi:hypothetical protein
VIVAEFMDKSACYSSRRARSKEGKLNCQNCVIAPLTCERFTSLELQVLLLDAFKPHVYPECRREANLTSEFFTCIASLASQDRDLRDLCCTLGCFKILKDAVVGFEHDSRMIRQLCFCIQALVRGNALNVTFFHSIWTSDVSEALLQAKHSTAA